VNSKKKFFFSLKQAQIASDFQYIASMSLATVGDSALALNIVLFLNVHMYYKDKL
jgi:hypothetical protein